MLEEVALKVSLQMSTSTTKKYKCKENQRDAALHPAHDVLMTTHRWGNLAEWLARLRNDL